MSRIPDDPADDTLREQLDLELDGLPEKYRRPIILFHLEGRSLEETAASLGSPVGTVGAWLSRGRELLRGRLSRRGAGAVTGAVLAALLGREASARTAGWGFARAAARAAAGGAVSPAVHHLTQGALNMMLFAKLKAAGIALVAASAFVAANAGLFSGAGAPLAAATPTSPSISDPAPLQELPQVRVTFEATERAPSPFPETAELVGHWKFDDEKGSATVADASGRGANGKIMGSAVLAEGKLGGALKVDGKGYVEIPNSEDLDKLQEGSFTISAWFKPENVPPGTESANDAQYTLVAKTGWHLGLTYTNEKKFVMTHWLAGEKPEEPVWTGTGAWNDEYEPGRWYHVVGTVDRAAGLVAIYVNGESMNTQDFKANAAPKKYEKETWKIGMASPGAAQWAWPAKGSIDDVRLYNRALSAAEVKSLYDGK